MAVTMDLAEHHMFCGGSEGSIFQVDLCTWVSCGCLGQWLETYGTVGHPGSVLQRPWDCPSPPTSRSLSQVDSSPAHHPYCPGAPRAEVQMCPSAHWPLGLRSLGRERRASSQNRTAGRCSRATGARARLVAGEGLYFLAPGVGGHLRHPFSDLCPQEPGDLPVSVH